MFRVALILLTGIALSAPRTVFAQETAAFPAERLRPAIDREGLIDVEWGVVGEHLSVDFTLGLGYAHNPLLLYRRAPDGTLTRAGSLVQHRLSADLIGAISLFELVQIGLHVPITLFQGRGPATIGAATSALQAVGLGDWRLIPKVQLLHAGRHYLDLAVMATLTFPTGVPKDNYMGETTVTFIPEIIVSRKLPGLRLAANIGVRLRETTRQLGLRVGHEITYRFGVGHRLDDYVDIPLEIDASLSGSIAMQRPFARFNRSPLEFLFGGAYDLGKLFQIYAGIGVGIVAGYAVPDARFFAGIRFSPRSGDRDNDQIKDALDSCPTEPEDYDDWEDEDGCPDLDNDGDGVPDVIDGAPFEPEDRDHFEDSDGVPDLDDDWDGIPDSDDRCPRDAEDFDGYEDEDGCPDLDRDDDQVPDAVDACPEEPEDRDGFQDLDGCPDVDNDGDGLADGEDRCPNQAETINGYQDDDGCPDVEPKIKVTVTRTELEIYGKVHFDTAKSIIKAKSFDLLRQVAKTLIDNPQIIKLEIEGHTDSEGSAQGNKFLSQDRADAVRRFFIKEGVDAKRLVAVGYGHTHPIASNATERGRTLNRRVAFTILETTEEKKP